MGEDGIQNNVWYVGGIQTNVWVLQSAPSDLKTALTFLDDGSTPVEYKTEQPVEFNVER